ncbi:hypothetical protein BB559_002876 [Furculomyces boomerangus]|uniref:Ribosomal protein/NADH dehydrogenase domain-containing protein n=2 Tax=Harpellales TaxID=61421 RepID=A0A2T9YRC9_9FUNG|nr:hypothetical protein BB559_003709 [Furculomyces boomerangus]PVU94910.1 hypothetical protein BB559_002876 [Furculomyces boomerangus]PWA00920.1 hypothetical protein BB558_003009 [Smittium angustum]
MLSKYQQLVQGLESGFASIKLKDSVKALTLNICQQSRSHGARHFWRENLPQLYYMNPNVKFTVNNSKEKIKPSIELETNSGKKVLDITGLSSQDIVRKLSEN